MSTDRRIEQPGQFDPLAALWAVAKTSLATVGLPVTLTMLTAAARRTTRHNARRIEAFGEHLLALADGGDPTLPAPRTVELDSTQRYLITSDLHRCISGRIDWPARAGVKELYRDVLRGYASLGWHLIENGDVEDYWMVGGSATGVAYDIAGLAGAVAAPVDGRLRARVRREQLHRIVDNNADIYRTIHDGFLVDGRYHRTIGNHDDLYADPDLVEQLRRHLPGVEVADTLLLRRSAEAGIGSVDAVVAHGHLTDSWNGPGFAGLGRAVTWFGTSLDDLPMMSGVDGLPGQRQLASLLSGSAPNRLVTVDARYGGNRRMDSLDEQRLFEALALDAPRGGWPWLVFGHTHLPMLEPVAADGSSVRYANSGSGVLPSSFTALEWDPESSTGSPLRLVVWQATEDGPRRTELVGGSERLTVRG